MKTVKFKVSGMHCRSCEMLIVDVLNEMGTESAEAHHKKGEVVVRFDDNKIRIEDIMKAIKKEGYEVTVDE
jgi:mercuric ion binding protein